MRLLHRPLPTPPDFTRQGPLRHGNFTSPLHNRYVAAWLGYALGWSFLVCFLTGLISHEVQQPGSWLPWPATPSWLYRATQGTHVATGLACVPLLLAKLWTVYPNFWEWPPARSVAHALERLTLLLLVGGSLLQVATGLSNIYQWYWFQFFFTPTHYYTSFVVVGALAIHIGTKISLARDALQHPDRYDSTNRGIGARALLDQANIEGRARAVKGARATQEQATAQRTANTHGLNAPRRIQTAAPVQWFLPRGKSSSARDEPPATHPDSADRP